jgi:hypothetical protein
MWLPGPVDSRSGVSQESKTRPSTGVAVASGFSDQSQLPPAGDGDRSAGMPYKRSSASISGLST